MPLPAISLVVAHSRNRVIGRDGSIPWHLPADLKRFKSLTMGKAVLMGRKTYESIGKPLPGRFNVVITRDRGWTAKGVVVANSFAEALAAAGNVPEVMVIGGAEIYRQALPSAQRIHLTLVDADIDGDTLFPEYTAADWEQTACEHIPADAQNPHPLSFITLERL